VTSTRGFMFRLLAIALLTALLTGCDKSSSPPAGSGAAAGSGEGPVVANGPTEKPAEPRAIDLRTLPPLDNAKYAIRAASRLEGTCSGKAAEVLEHFRAALEKPGWKPTTPLPKGDAGDESASAMLSKGPDSIFLSVSRNGQGDEKQFSVGDLGTCDSSKLPRLAGAEHGYDGTISTVYFTDMQVAATAASVRNLLLAGGWQEFDKPLMKKIESPGFVQAEYRKQGNSLRVLVSAAAGSENRSSVKYVIGAIGHELPAPANATGVEFDDALWMMRCTIPGDLEPTAKYYRTAMPELGFDPPQDLDMSETDMVLTCESKDKDVVIIKLHFDGDNTHAELHGISAYARKNAGKGGS